MHSDAEVRAFEALSQHPRIADLAAVAREALAVAFETRAASCPPDRVADFASKRHLAPEEAATEFGNALEALAQPPSDDRQRALACALAAHAILRPSSRDAGLDWSARASELVWLAAHTPFDATRLVGRALGDGAGSFWSDMADRLRDGDSAQGPLSMVGEVTPRPRGTVVTVALALSGVLFLLRVGRLIGRVALSYRRPAEVTLAADGGLRVRCRVEMLGRTLGDSDVVVPRAALVSAAREVRYPRLGLCAGLLALVVGTYVGTVAFVDGVRSASPSLVASGLVIIAVGLALDLLGSIVAPGARSRCRVVFVTRVGTPLCVGLVEIAHADALLARLAERRT